MSRPLLLAEELSLLTHDDDSGRSAGTTALANGLAGALLRAAQEEIRRSSRPREPGHRVQRLPSALKELPAQVGRSLAEAGVLAEERRVVWKIFPTTRWPEVDPEPERELRARVAEALVEDRAPDPRTAMCVSLLVPLDPVPGVVPRSTGGPRRPARRGSPRTGSVPTSPRRCPRPCRR